MIHIAKCHAISAKDVNDMRLTTYEGSSKSSDSIIVAERS